MHLWEGTFSVLFPDIFYRLPLCFRYHSAINLLRFGNGGREILPEVPVFKHLPADQLALPKAADDSMNFQDRRSCRAEDKKAGGKHRGGYSPDFKRPDNSGAGGTQADFYQADMEKTEPYRDV